MENGAAGPPGRVDELAVQDLLAAITRHRVTETLEPHARQIGIPDDVVAALGQRRRTDRSMLAVRHLELGRAGEVLSSGGIRWMQVKGSALAVQTTGRTDGRGFGDIDLFIAPDDVRDAVRLLTAAGWEQRGPRTLPDSWGWRYMLDTSYELTFDSPGSTLDLHWRLGPTHHAMAGFEDAWSRRVGLDLDGLAVATLSVGDALTHACHHAAKDEWRWMRSLVDVHRLARLPGAWPRELSLVERNTFHVTGACFGLPDEVPGPARATIQRTPLRVLRRAMIAQSRPLETELPPPGVETLRQVRRSLAESRALPDVRRTLAAAIVPYPSVADLDDRTAWTAVPRMLGRRVRRVVDRWSAWRRIDGS